MDLQQPSSPTDGQSQPQVSMPAPSHRWGLVTAIAGIAVILSAGAYFVIAKQYNTNVTVSTYTPRPASDTSGWKTYTSADLGFSMNYPKNWTISIIKTNVSVNNKLVPVIKTRFISPELVMSNNSIKNNTLPPGDYPTFTYNISVVYSSDATAYMGTSDVATYAKQTSDTPDQAKQINFNGMTSWQSQVGGLSGTETGTILINNGHVYEIRVNEAAPGNKDVASEILSTFKFTSPIDTSTWKTYTNTKYGYQLKYPNGTTLNTDARGGVVIVGPESSQEPENSESGPSGGISPPSTTSLTDNSQIPFGSCVKSPVTLPVGIYTAVKTDQCDFAGSLEIFWIANGKLWSATAYVDRDLVVQILSTFKFTK